MTIEVWHRDTPTWRDNDTTELARTFPAGFTHVADVETACVGDVFQLTNHIDADWRTNARVTPRTWNPVRSTSVGDVYVKRGDSGLPQAGAAKIQDAWTVDGLGLRKWI